MNTDRRTLLRGIGAVGATLTFSGLASAGDGSAQYIVGGNGENVARRLDEAEFTVRHVLAEGRVAVVTGPAGAGDELAATDRKSVV